MNQAQEHLVLIASEPVVQAAVQTSAALRRLRSDGPGLSRLDVLGLA